MQEVYNIAQICARLGVKEAVMSPGSRCALLTLAFHRHPDINETMVYDERSAAYTALGKSLISKRPVVLTCTSGSAAANYLPAITEAYYQRIPLIILTADRPPEWTDQGDGQTIRQQGLYHNHIKKSYQLPVDTLHPDAKWQYRRTISEAIMLSKEAPQGPVHINVPVREPFYPGKDEVITFDDNIRIIKEEPGTTQLASHEYFHLCQEAKKYERILIVAGQGCHAPDIRTHLEACQLPVVADCIANLHSDINIVRHHDIFLLKANQEAYEQLKPDLVISFGNPVLSKALKHFFRHHQPKAHWHVEPSGTVPDTFQSLTRIVRSDVGHFFHQMNYASPDAEFLSNWLFEENKANIYLNTFLQDIAFGELAAFQEIVNILPENSVLHLGNSMPVRYANLFSWHKSVRVFANRGTSGIDGSLSTAVGSASADPAMHTIVLGDMSFFYDRNALWQQTLPDNLRIIVLNNGGGGIFNMIDGPSQLPEAADYFITKNHLSAKNTANDFQLAYHKATNRDELVHALNDFYAPSSKPKILEVFTDNQNDAALFRSLKSLTGYGE